jgi:hypothetical protein
MNPTKRWLDPYPWAVIVYLNLQACNSGKVLHQAKPGNHDDAKSRWDTARDRELTLREVLELCRECHRAAPFQFFNGNTFASVARSVIQDVLKQLPPTKAHIFKSAVGHFVAGTIEPPEFDNVYKSVLNLLKNSSLSQNASTAC